MPSWFGESLGGTPEAGGRELAGSAHHTLVLPTKLQVKCFFLQQFKGCFIGSDGNARSRWELWCWESRAKMFQKWRVFFGRPQSECQNVT